MKKIVALVLSLVMVLGLATTAFAAADKYDLYLADETLATQLKLGDALDAWTGTTIKSYDAKANQDGSGNVAYMTMENVSSGADYYFVKTETPTWDDYAVTAHGKTEVLFYVDYVQAADVVYEATAKAFNNFGTKCGQIYQVTTTNVYYEITAAAADSVFEAEDVVLAVVATAYPNYKNVLVGDEIKTVAAAAEVAQDTLGADKLLKHKWAVTGVVYSAALNGNVPTEMKCLNCGDVVDTFYLGKGNVPAGKEPVAVPGYNGWFFVEPAATAVVAPSVDATEKVESAETFDAGIAMYVGMSVMAAAGSAVVLKKKD